MRDTKTQNPDRKKKKTNPTAPVVRLTGERVGRKWKVTATHDGRTVHFDTIDFDRSPQRERFIKGVCKRLPDVDAATLEADLLRLPETVATPAPYGPAGEPDPPLARVIISYTHGPPGRNWRKGRVTAE